MIIRTNRALIQDWVHPKQSPRQGGAVGERPGTVGLSCHGDLQSNLGTCLRSCALRTKGTGGRIQRRACTGQFWCQSARKDILERTEEVAGLSSGLWAGLSMGQRGPAQLMAKAECENNMWGLQIFFDTQVGLVFFFSFP